MNSSVVHAHHSERGSEAGIAQGFDASPASDNLAQLHSLCRGSTFFLKDPRRFDTAYRLEKEVGLGQEG